MSTTERTAGTERSREMAAPCANPASQLSRPGPARAISIFFLFPAQCMYGRWTAWNELLLAVHCIAEQMRCAPAWPLPLCAAGTLLHTCCCRWNTRLPPPMPYCSYPSVHGCCDGRGCTNGWMHNRGKGMPGKGGEGASKPWRSRRQAISCCCQSSERTAHNNAGARGAARRMGGYN